MVAVSSPVKTIVGDLKKLYYKQKDDIDQSIQPHPLWEAIWSYSFSKLPSPMGIKIAPILIKQNFSPLMVRQLSNSLFLVCRNWLNGPNLYNKVLDTYFVSCKFLLKHS